MPAPHLRPSDPRPKDSTARAKPLLKNAGGRPLQREDHCLFLKAAPPEQTSQYVGKGKDRYRHEFLGGARTADRQTPAACLGMHYGQKAGRKRQFLRMK